MENNIPYGSQWIKDLVPNVSWDSATSNIKMPDGSVLPKSAYTIVDSKAYVQPDAVSKYVANPAVPTPVKPATTQPASYGIPAGAPAGSASTVQVANAPPANSMWIRDLVPNAVWDQANQSITLPTGDVLPKNLYTLVGGKAYVNPYAIAEYYTPKNTTPETMQPWIDKATDIYKPMMDSSMERINSLITTLQSKLDANIAGLNAQGDITRGNLQRQETADSNKLRDQAIARGTYTSGVADHQQGELAGDYAPQYSQLEGTIASAIAAARANAADATADLGSQATEMQSGWTDKIMALVSSLMGESNTNNQSMYDNITGKAANTQDMNTAALDAALARTEMFGKVVTQADADLLGVPVGTSSLNAQQSYSSGGTSGGGDPGTLDLNNLTTDQKRSFDAAMSLWKVTGTAPAGILQQLGIPLGTGYTTDIANNMAQDAKVGSLIKAITSISSSAKPINIEAAAYYLTGANNNANAAINNVKANQDALLSEGANIAEIVALINKTAGNDSSFSGGYTIPPLTNTVKAVPTYTNPQSYIK